MLEKANALCVSIIIPNENDSFSSPVKLLGPYLSHRIGIVAGKVIVVMIMSGINAFRVTDRLRFV